jgi:hypothetical protein
MPSVNRTHIKTFCQTETDAVYDINDAQSQTQNHFGWTVPFSNPRVGSVVSFFLRPNFTCTHNTTHTHTHTQTHKHTHTHTLRHTRGVPQFRVVADLIYSLLLLG